MNLKSFIVIILLLGLLFTIGCNRDKNEKDSYEPAYNHSSDWTSVSRTTDKIVFDEEKTVNLGSSSWKFDFYRNLEYDCGLSGKYTFLVTEPKDNPGSEAPLWVYLHGGGMGYYDDQGKYRTGVGQTEDAMHHEESFEKLQSVITRNVINNRQLIDTTIKRRIEEGYRILTVSLCDHDLYSRMGTPYINNPDGGQVNGLQATMAAVEYTVENYPTTHVFAHGTSAGSIGAFSLMYAFAMEGTYLTGTIIDSYLLMPRINVIFETFSGTSGFPFDDDFELHGITEKIGWFTDFDISPNGPAVDTILNGFVEVPLLTIVGELDSYCAGDQYTISEAKAAGLDNCAWVVDGLRQAIDEQPDSPHQLVILEGWAHTPSVKDSSPAHDVVDDFIDEILSNNPSYPFDE